MAVLAFIKQHIATTDATTYTFSSTSTGGANDIGALASDRQVIIGAQINATSTAGRTISSITAGGVTTTIPVSKSAAQTATAVSNNRTFCIAVAHAALTTATSISIVLTATTTVANAAITVWSASECAASAATFGFTFSSATVGWSTGTSGTFIATVGTGGFFVSEADHGTAAASYVWTNATERHDTVVESVVTHSGADATVSNTVTVQPSASVFFGAVFAVFNSTTATAAASTLFRPCLPFKTGAGHRQMYRSMPHNYEWIPPAAIEHEARL